MDVVGGRTVGGLVARKEVMSRSKCRLGMCCWWLDLAQGHPVETAPAESLLGITRESICFLAADDDDNRNSNEGSRLSQRVWSLLLVESSESQMT